MEAKDYAKKNFKISELLKVFSYLDRGDAASSQAAPPRLDFQVPVAVAAVGSTAEEPANGFLFALHELIMSTPWKKSTGKVLDMMADLALHCPMDIYAFYLQPEVERKIFLKSFQIL